MLSSLTHLAGAEGKEVLVVSVTTGFRHDSIPVAEEVLEGLAARNHLSIDFARTEAEMGQKMTRAALQRYDLIVFANTTGDLPLPDRDAFLGWLAAGHGFVGVHSAADTFHGYLPYLEMLGGEFETHGDQSSVVLDVIDDDHPSTRELASRLTVFEEIYQFRRFDPSRVRLLITLDRHPNTGEPGLFPISWVRSHGRGRVFYTALGHREDVWLAPWFQQHLEGALRWAIAPNRRRPARR
jgi:type 1 glutamine amidotransferase